MSQLPSLYVAENKHELHKNYVKIKHFEILQCLLKKLEFTQSQKSDEVQCIIYAYFECLIEKIDRYESNPENSSTTKVGEHIPSGFSMPKISSFKSIENKHA